MTDENGQDEQQAGSVLETLAVTKAFGGLTAVDDVNFTIPEKAIVSIIGPNGAGKTTFFNMLTGLYRPTAGRIFFDGRDITYTRPDRILARGIARTFQNIRLFATMSALENVLVGQHARMKAGLFRSILRTPAVHKEEREVREKARELLEYVGLKPDVIGQMAINLAYGDQRRVEIARALASDPTLLLLDEPTAGMNPEESKRLTEFMRKLRDDRGLTILLIEHDMKVVMGVSERITVLDHGEMIAEGLARRGPEEPAGDRGLPRKAGELAMALLELHEVHTFYGTIEALKGISLEVNEGEIVTLIGSNGAGKSTTLRSISGLTPPREGSIKFDGEEIGETAPQDIVRHGISQAPEGRRIFEPHERAREPRARRLSAEGRGAGRRGHGPRLRAVPAAQGA